MVEKQLSELFDKPIKGSKFNEDELPLNFDGTVLGGNFGIKVDLDLKGRLKLIRSIDLKSGNEGLSFVPGVVDGWRGEWGYHAQGSALGRRLETIIESHKEYWELWNRTKNVHKNKDFRSWKESRVRAEQALRNGGSRSDNGSTSEKIEETIKEIPYLEDVGINEHPAELG